jgi:DNA-binding NarL/FixJ family response regulator
MHGPVINVLVVDDSPDVASMLSAMLSLEPDMNVVGTLTDAADLVETATELRPAVVLLDLTMPGKDPIEALKELKASQAGAAVRVVAYSGHDGPETEAAVRAAGAWGLVSKASEPSVVAAAVRSATRGENA